jgi:D-serine dehydratase
LSSSALIDSFLDTLGDCAQRCDQENLFAAGEVLLTAGGSMFFDRVSAKLGQVRLSRPTIVLLRGGCYLTHDNGLWALAFERLKARSPDSSQADGELIPALEVWAYVQSLPEPGLAIASLGKRDISFDELPVAVKWFRPGGGMSVAMPLMPGYSVSRLNDQHCYLNIPPHCPWRVGDMIGFGISHPCLTFDKWRVLHLVDDDYCVTGSVRTYF